MSAELQERTPIRTLIVEDETPARQWLRTLCARIPDVRIIGECATAGEASRALRTSTVDLLLLDIQLGAHTGFHVLDGVACSAVPSLVFVTAHDQYAVRAFDRRAVDYLLKPVREDRFRESLERVRRQLRGGMTSEIQSAVRESIMPLEQSLLSQRTHSFAERLIAERDGAYRVVECRRMATLESDANYVRVTEEGVAEPAILRGTLQGLADILDPNQFLRVNRFVIVNLAHVDRIERDVDSHLVFVMKDARRFAVGRAFAGDVQRVMRLGAI
jgi:two-component system, LytTR family, response regulator